MKQLPTCAAALILLAGSTHAATGGLFGPTVELADLNGADGFIIHGVNEGDFAGKSVSAAGDINGDGVDDIIIGAWGVETTDDYTGAVYVVFGASDIGASTPLELASLNGANGFVIYGQAENDRFGESVSAAGDVNGDGLDDIIIGASYATGTSGASYILFGAANIGAGGVFDLATLDGSNGFFARTSQVSSDGRSVDDAGDINGDGDDDLIIGAPFASFDRVWTGAAYVVFGGVGVGASGDVELSDVDGVSGFLIKGIEHFDETGQSVAAAGDINNDGMDDVIIGSPTANHLAKGRAYVVFGDANVGAGGTLELATINGANGFVMNGLNDRDWCGWSVTSPGDINADGVVDVIVAAHQADPNGDRSGQCYVIFGGDNVGATGEIDLTSLDGDNGFVINGANEYDICGMSVASAGDINGDGVDDLLIGARNADGSIPYTGVAYVLFGKPDIGAGGVFELTSVNGNNGFAINGRNQADQTGVSVSAAGDVNNDGADDIIIGAWGDDTNGEHAGATYILFGKPCNEADLTGDCIVTAVDIAELLGAWGPCPAEPDPCPADLDGSGNVGASDLAILIGAWTN